MKAIGFRKSLPITNKDSLVLFEKETPKPKGDDVLVKIRAVSVNPVDYKVRQSLKPDVILEDPKILGFDASGEIVEVGKDVMLFQKGDEVYYSGTNERDGSNAEYQLISQNLVGKKPKNLSFSDAAALPLTALTAWEAIFERLCISKNANNKRILIIGGAGGMGSMAIQLLKQMTQLKIIATSSKPESKNWCQKLGAEIVVDYNHLVENLEKEGIKEVDYILNFTDTEMYWEAMCDLIKPLGAICSIVPPQNPINLGLLFGKSVSFSWELMFTKSSFNVNTISHHYILNELSELFENNLLASTATKVLSGFNVENFRQAHKWLESRNTTGKIVVEF